VDVDENGCTLGWIYSSSDDVEPMRTNPVAGVVDVADGMD
jgi:hypothetical protein